MTEGRRALREIRAATWVLLLVGLVVAGVATLSATRRDHRDEGRFVPIPRSILVQLRGPAGKGERPVDYAVAEVTGDKDPWVLPDGDGAVRRGQLPVARSAAIELATLSTEAGEPAFVSVLVQARTNNGVREHVGERNRIVLRCVPVEGGVSQEFPVTVHFFETATSRGEVSVEKVANTPGMFFPEGVAHLSLELDSQRLSAHFDREGAFDLLFHLTSVIRTEAIPK